MLEEEIIGSKGYTITDFDDRTTNLISMVKNYVTNS
jgi:hypothetical protein